MRIAALALISTIACTGDIGGIHEPDTDNPIDRPRPGDAEVLAPLARRLTTDELINTIRDVIGIELSNDEVALLPVDRPLEGFVNIASGQTVLPEHVLAYSRVAEAIVTRPAFDDFIGDYASCRDRSCRDEFVSGAGAALFRRPLNADEQASFNALFDAVDAEGVSFEESASAVTRAMLQSPQFLYLLQNEIEGRDTREIGGYEMASRLSYTLWATAPDQALYDAAAAGDLDDADGVADQVRRMLADNARVASVAERFMQDWGRLEALPDDDGLRAELVQTATAYYAAQVVEGADLFDLFADGKVFLTPALAERYGVESAGDGVREYDVSGLAGRGGLLTQPGIVAGMTNSDGGEIVARGLFLQHQLFCGETPDPPASLQDEIDEFIAEQPDDASARMIAETRLMRNECGACHSQFDPLAYGFEQLDFRGAFRTEDEFGNTVTVDGWIPARHTNDDEDQHYTNFAEYMQLLRTNERVRRCLTQRQAEYALGSVLGEGQQAQVWELAEEISEGGGDFATLIEAVTTHDLFRTVEVVEP